MSRSQSTAASLPPETRQKLGIEILAFAGVLDQKLEEISFSFDVPLQKVCDVCLLQRKAQI
jgi:hypothetical protein